MSDQIEQTQDAPPITIMRRHLQKIFEHISTPKFPRGSAVLAIAGFRHQLGKIYGKDSPQVANFTTLRADVDHEILRTELRNRAAIAERIINMLLAVPLMASEPRKTNRVFIGHGRSPVWRELKDFLSERLGLPWDEFNREPTAGLATSERLQGMVDNATFAFLIMTAEEEHADSSIHARPNVIHEVGLFQGKLGIRRAIILLEEGCSEFSNVIGLTQIRFPRGDISARFEEIRRVLEREGIIN